MTPDQWFIAALVAILYLLLLRLGFVVWQADWPENHDPDSGGPWPMRRP